MLCGPVFIPKGIARVGVGAQIGLNNVSVQKSPTMDCTLQVSDLERDGFGTSKALTALNS